MQTAETEPETLQVADAQALLGSRLVDEMEPAQPIAAAAKQQESAEKQQVPPVAAAGASAGSSAAPTDAEGNLFDPLLHETDDEGRPVFRKGNRWLKRRRTPLKEWKETSTMGTLPEEPEDDPAAARQEAREQGAAAEAMMINASATTIVGAQVMLMRLALGDECATLDAERKGLVDAWEGVLRHYGMATVHPLLGVALVTGAVAFRAVHEPRNESSITKLKHWVQRQALWAWQKVTGRRAAAKGDQVDVKGAEARGA